MVLEDQSVVLVWEKLETLCRRETHTPLVASLSAFFVEAVPGSTWVAFSEILARSTGSTHLTQTLKRHQSRMRHEWGTNDTRNFSRRRDVWMIPLFDLCLLLPSCGLTLPYETDFRKVWRKKKKKKTRDDERHEDGKISDPTDWFFRLDHKNSVPAGLTTFCMYSSKHCSKIFSTTSSHKFVS